jgi:hypothetical protein
MDWILLDQSEDKWRVISKTVLSLVLQNWRVILLKGRMAISLLERNML